MMDHNSYYHPPFNHLQHPLSSNPPSPVHAPAPGPLDSPEDPADPADNHYAPASPSDFIYNSASIFQYHHSPRPSFQPSFSFSNEPVLPYPPEAVYHGSDPSKVRPVKQSFPTTYLPGLPKPAPGFGEHRRQRQSTMNSMGPGPSKAVPPALSLGGDQGGNTRNSSESTVVVIKRGEEEEEEGSLSPVPWVSIPLGQRVKRWEARMPQGKQVEGDVVGYVPLGTENGMGSRSGSNIWGERGEGVIERVVMPVVPGIGTEMRMGVGMDEPTIMPKMGLFRPVRWDGPSSSFSRSKAKARRVRAWKVEEGPGGNDVHVQRTLGTQNENGNSNRNQNEETENEQPAAIHLSSSPYSRSPKRLKTSSQSGCIYRPGPAETESETDTGTTIKIKEEPGLSPPPSAFFTQIPMYNNGTINNTAAGYESSGQYDNSLSSRSISPLTRVPAPRRVLFPTPNRTSTGSGVTAQPSLRAVGKQLKKRNREMALDREESRERRGEGFLSVAGGNQGQTHDASPQQQQQHNRGSSEEREKGWTTISGSSEEGEVSSYYEADYSCGQERRDRNNNTHQKSSPFFSPTDQQEWYHPFSSSPSSSSAPVPEASARYHHVSAPSLSASQMREEEQYWQQAIQMVQDTCLEASKRYIRAHCVNRGARGGGGGPDTSVPLSHRSETGTARSKARRMRKLKSRQVSSSSGSSSSSSSSSPSPSPLPPRRRRKRQSRRSKKRTTTTPPSSPSSPPPDEIHLSDSLLPNISHICTLLWSRSQSLRLHDTDSIELHAARNMYWLLSWGETVAFAVLPTTVTSTVTSTSTGFTVPDLFDSTCTSGGTSSSSVGSLVVAGFGGFGGSPSSFRHRDRDRAWEDCGEGLMENDGYIWRKERGRDRNSEGSGGFEMLESRNGCGRAVREQQRIQEVMKRVFDEGGMLCEFLGYGEGVERLGRVREFYGLW